MRRKLISFCSLVLALCGCATEGPSAYIDFNIKPDSSCIVSPGTGDNPVFLASGVYDISTGTNGFCENPYQLALRVNSQLRPGMDMELGRAEPNVLVVTEAVVKLLDREGATLRLAPDDSSDGPALPNPFKVNTNLALRPTDTGDPSLGIVFVEAIPTPYAAFLGTYVDDQILVEVQLFGTTLGDVEVDFTPYVYPVRICRGCQTICAENVDQDKLDESDTCQDNVGYDGRICVDPCL